jgi:hypothetical protein
VRLVEQWRRIESELPAEWTDARLSLSVSDERMLTRAAALLGPANPGRAGSELRLGVTRRAGPTGAEAVRRHLRRLDEGRVRGTLTLVGVSEAPRTEPVAASMLEAAWETALATLPPDWSDLHCELELTSTDQLARVALLLSPLNPLRDGKRAALRFRVARRFGYGASPEMVRRCLARVDADGIRGRVSILRALSDTHNVATQGPVWYVEGRAV